MAVKTYVIDTNVFLYDPEALLKYPHQKIVIPVTVLEELDRMKRLPNELGKNARVIFRLLDSFKKEGKGSFHTGVTISNGSTIKIQLEGKAFQPEAFRLSINDNRIIMAAFMLKEQGEDVVFVSKDFAARIKAGAIGLKSEDYELLKTSFESIYRGYRKIEVEKHVIDTFFKDGKVKIDTEEEFNPNEYCVLTSPENSSAVGKYDPVEKAICPLIKVPDLWGVQPRNVEQRCSVDSLMRDNVKLVTLVGPAGTGKTLLALACGMRKVFDENIYTKILVSRPVVPLGRDIGYLPGTKEEKLLPWMQPIYDNLEFLCDSTDAKPNETLQWVMSSQKIEMEAVTYIRGRSIPNVYIIIDEAQNLTPHEIKTVISRAGEGTKVVLTGDPTQIDNPYLDKDSNGLTYAVNRFKSHKIYGHLFLEKTERSQLAALAAELL